MAITVDRDMGSQRTGRHLANLLTRSAWNMTNVTTKKVVSTVTAIENCFRECPVPLHRRDQMSLPSLRELLLSLGSPPLPVIANGKCA
jgi:hypothetical protein